MNDDEEERRGLQMLVICIAAAMFLFAFLVWYGLTGN
jgi:hypothetical protein